MDLINAWQDWEITAGNNSLTLLAPTDEALDRIDNYMINLLKQKAKFIDIFLGIKGGVRQKIRPTQSVAVQPNAQLKEILPSIRDPEWEAIALNLDVPIWVFHHYDLRTLWANDAALAPQAKPRNEIVGCDASGLDKPEELERIARFLERDHAIHAMEFQGYRWGRMAENESIYTRVEHQFVEHWELVEWEGMPARLGVVLSATPVSQVIL